ncbi:hypothetical protein GCM10009551_099940 [Nocardiopsis tropica]|uniref:hypothetical protein n=1 Tax=Tsukamurella strandjordii TaxID=147577 RepID=UPI0031DB57A3
MKRLVPERTIDSLFAYEFLVAAPTALFWSPANTQKGIWDHDILHAGQRLLIECKGLLPPSSTKSTDWQVPIDLTQLQRYVGQPLTRSLVYILPAMPSDVARPWLRDCQADPDDAGHCLACSDALAQQWGRAVQSRRWAGKSSAVASATYERRLQPWFSHWAWCVSALDLSQHLSWTRGSSNSISAADRSLGSIQGATRLCHLLASVALDFDGRTGELASSRVPRAERGDYEPVLGRYRLADDVRLTNRVLEVLDDSDGAAFAYY